jgi:DNA-binding MarR family transcriptional regulator
MTNHALHSLRQRYGLAGVYLQLMPVLRALEKENGQTNENKLAGMEAVRWLIEQLLSNNKALEDQLNKLEQAQ